MITWYLARGAGLAALILLSTSTALGALGSRRTDPGRRYVVQYVHRAAAGLGVLTLALHIGAILADSYAGVGWRGAVVPFTSGYRPNLVALGSIAAYLFVAVALLGLARGRLASSTAGARTWRGLHALAYAGWAAAIGHGFFTGTDSETGWVRLLYVACLAGVVAAVGVRLATLRPAGDPARRLVRRSMRRPVRRPVQGALR